MRNPIAASLATVVLLAVSACGASGEAAQDQADTGGELVYLDAEPPESFQLQTGGTFWQTMAIVSNVTDRLVYIDPETRQATPWIAESWEVDDDGLTYTFELIEGVTYSDGSALDAQNVARNLEINAYGDESRGITRQSFFPEVDSVTAGEGTVTVTLAEPRAGFLQLLGHSNLGLVADATLDLSNEEQSRAVNLIGSGPFIVGSETPGREIVLERRDDYAWPAPATGHEGPAYLDAVTVLPVQEDSVRLGTLTAGQGDALRYLPPSEYRGLQTEGYSLIAAHTNGSPNGFYIKQTAPFVSDLNVRKALQIGIDREGLLRTIYTEEWTEGRGLLSPESTWFLDSSQEIAHDPDRANELLEAAGWAERDADGIRIRDGERLEIITYVDVYDNTSKPRLEYIQSGYRELGIHLEIKETDYSSFPNAIQDPAVGLNRASTAGLDPYFLYNSLHSSTADGFGLEGADEHLDELLSGQLHATDDDERGALLEELQEYVIDEAYFIPVVSSTQIFVTAPHVRDFGYDGNALPEFLRVWLSA